LSKRAFVYAGEDEPVSDQGEPLAGKTINLALILSEKNGGGQRKLKGHNAPPFSSFDFTLP
jgi:hypothetical protein